MSDCMYMLLNAVVGADVVITVGSCLSADSTHGVLGESSEDRCILAELVSDSGAYYTLVHVSIAEFIMKTGCWTVVGIPFKLDDDDEVVKHESVDESPI